MGQRFSRFTRSLTLTGLGGEGDPSTENRFSPYERGLFNFIAVLDAVAVLES